MFILIKQYLIKIYFGHSGPGYDCKRDGCEFNSHWGGMKCIILLFPLSGNSLELRQSTRNVRELDGEWGIEAS